jgi:hypothetical protein
MVRNFRDAFIAPFWRLMRFWVGGGGLRMGRESSV